MESTPQERNAAFYDALPNLVASHDLKDRLRRTSRGILVREDSLDFMIAAYQRWQLQATGSDISIDKAKRKLMDDGSTVLWYALDGKRCIPGFLLPGGPHEPRKSAIVPYEAHLLDSRVALHPRDPKLATVPGLECLSLPRIGIAYRLLTKHRSIVVPESILISLVETLRRSSKRYLEDQAIRDSLPRLAELLNACRPLRKKERALLPSGLSIAKPNVAILGRVYLLIDAEGVVRSVYELHGKNAAMFMTNELQRAPRVPQFDSVAGSGPIIGKLWQRGASFKLTRRALLQFVVALRRSKRVPKGFPDYFQMHQAVKELVALFAHAATVEERTIARSLGPNREPQAKYRRNGGWIFVIGDKNTVTAVLEVREERASRPRPAAQR